MAKELGYQLKRGGGETPLKKKTPSLLAKVSNEFEKGGATSSCVFDESQES